MTRSEGDYYATPGTTIMPLMQDMITNGQARQWGRILDLGAGDGRLGASAAEAYNFSRFGEGHTPPVWVEGVEPDVDRADDCMTRGFNYVQCMTLEDASLSILRPDLIISNPPFSLAQEFLTEALAIRERLNADVTYGVGGPTVLFLLRLNFLGAQKRYEWWHNMERPKLRVLSQRPSFKDGGTDMTDYAWYVWSDDDIPALEWYAPQG